MLRRDRSVNCYPTATWFPDRCDIHHSLKRHVQSIKRWVSVPWFHLGTLAHPLLGPSCCTSSGSNSVS
jgi:hypothetical protein